MYHILFDNQLTIVLQWLTQKGVQQGAKYPVRRRETKIAGFRVDRFDGERGHEIQGCYYHVNRN